MNRRVRFFVSISTFLCHLLFRIPGASAQVPSQLHSPLTVEIKADSQEKSGDLYHLTGHVEVRYADMRLAADRMDYNAGTGEIVASGNLHFTRPEQNEDIWGTEGTYNLRNDNHRGWLSSREVFDEGSAMLLQ